MVPIVRLGALLGLVFLSGCGQNLNISRIESRIQDDIERQGRRLTLKDVICPGSVAKQAEAYFRCVGELPDGGQFTINVIQQDDQGSVVWDVPSSKVIINLASLEESIQDELKDAVGKRLTIDCGDTYRINQRGDTFECDVIGAGTVAAGRVVSILVKVGGDSNLEWQEVVVDSAPVAGGTAPGAGSAPTGAATASPQTAATPETQQTPVSETAPAASQEEEDDEDDRQ
ncbi:MAG: hypothetical protein AAF821_06045 [Cyanobacteria bacterium P01_D01_bin.156]